MENELYVVALIQSSERAREAVAEAMGNLAMRDVLARLTQLGKAEAEEVLAELAMRIQAKFAPPALPSAFTEAQLRQLVDPRTFPVLAMVLGCAEADVLATLLDSHRLARTLGAAGHTAAGIDDSELLLLTILNRLPQLRVDFGLESADWNWFIEEEGWLTPTAVDRLTEVARQRRWPEGIGPARILAGVLTSGRGRERVRDDAGQFDALALGELRRRVAMIAEQLRTTAAEYAEQAAALAPDLASIAQLPACIDLYERSSVALGLNRLFTRPVTLGEQLSGLHDEPPPVTGRPEAEQYLLVTEETTYGLGEKLLACSVACAIEGNSQPTIILKCRDIELGAYLEFRNGISQLRGADLSPLGETVGDRLLNTPLPWWPSLADRLRAALRSHVPEVTQCIVLTGQRQPIVVPPPWHEHLTAALPFEALSDGDTSLPDLASVVQALRDNVSPTRRVEEVVE